MTTVRVHLCWSSNLPRELRDGVVVVLDLIRASTTMVRALQHGAARVIPCMEPSQAMEAARAEPGSLLGGERGGLALPGFDLGNSPDEYTPQRVRGKTVCFTTTNGTRAILRARDAGASGVYIGALSNRAAVCRVLMRGNAPHVHLLCAGIEDRVCLDDTIAAGGYAMLLESTGATIAPVQDDSTLLAMDAFAQAAGGDIVALMKPKVSTLEESLKRSQGGRNLAEIGLLGDLRACAAIDESVVVPRVREGSTTLEIVATD